MFFFWWFICIMKVMISVEKIVLIFFCNDSRSYICIFIFVWIIKYVKESILFFIKNNFKILVDFLGFFFLLEVENIMFKI